ncbi:MAG: response regulator [Verrucomicrobiia bacterium]
MSDVILYIEDEENDVLLAEIAFRRAQIAHRIAVVRDGLQAIDYLAGHGKFADREAHPLPRLVLLDLKLPHKSGFEVLEWIRNQKSLQSLPVVIYTSSGAPSDRERATKLGASDYRVKPSRMSEMTEMAASLGSLLLESREMSRAD